MSPQPNYLEEKCQYGDAMILVQGALKVRKFQAAHNHMQLGGIGVIVNQILAAHSVVLAPVEMELFELVEGHAFQGAALHARHLALVEVHGDQHSVSIVGQIDALGRNIKVLEGKFCIRLVLHIQHVDINGTLELAAALLIVVAPMLRAMLSSVAKILRPGRSSCNN